MIVDEEDKGENESANSTSPLVLDASCGRSFRCCRIGCFCCGVWYLFLEGRRDAAVPAVATVADATALVVVKLLLPLPSSIAAAADDSTTLSESAWDALAVVLTGIVDKDPLALVSLQNVPPGVVT